MAKKAAKKKKAKAAPKAKMDTACVNAGTRSEGTRGYKGKFTAQGTSV